MKTIPWLDLARDMQNSIVQERRTLHTMPELGFEEVKTAAYVADKLAASGYKVRTGVGRTGVIADLGSPKVAIRAEMDGLALVDSSAALYRSHHPGLSHSCGHDVNMACVLAAAKLLAQEKIAGIRIIMQPAAEETCDAEGFSGTARIIASGAMQGLAAIITMHIDSTLPTGAVGIITESAKAAANRFKVTIKAAAQSNFDAVRAANQFMSEVLGSTSGGDTSSLPKIIINSIETSAPAGSSQCSEQVVLGGVLQAFSKESSKEQYQRMEQVASQLAESGIDCAIALSAVGTGDLDGEINELLRQTACSLIGEQNVRLVKRKTWTEDFAALLAVTRGSMFLLGGEIQSNRRSHHSSAFDVDEANLYVGAALLAATAQELLKAAD
jgi:amidohydrolase